MKKKIVLDGKTYVAEFVPALKEWHVGIEGEGGELGQFLADGTIVNVDQHDYAASHALLARVRDAVLAGTR